jgi:hypothetical protein
MGAIDRSTSFSVAPEHPRTLRGVTADSSPYALPYRQRTSGASPK